MPLLLLGLTFAAACAWRDSPTLKTLDVLAILLLLSMVAWRRQGGSLLQGTLTSYLTGFLHCCFQTLFGILSVLFKSIHWQEVPTGHWTSRARRALLGGLLALPFLILFGILFSAADAIFNQLVVDLLDIQAWIPHLIVIGAGAWLTGGYLRAILLADSPPTPPVQAKPSRLALGSVELGVALGCLNLLFLAFILVQFRYFFGGETQLEITPGLLRSEYARRGFFELVTVAALLLPLLLSADWLLRNEQRKSAFQILAASLVVMLFLIMASAWQRMWIYQKEFGLTELRLYTTAFMAWLALLFIWFLLTVLRGHRNRFTCGAIASALVLLHFLHALNPDGLIVRTNAAHAQTGHPFDTSYALSLSTDATPALLNALPHLPPPDQTLIRSGLLNRSPNQEWRSWSLSRAQARQAVATQLQPSK